MDQLLERLVVIVQMDGLSMCSLAVSRGNVDTLVQHPASMTHRLMSEDDRLAVGITDGMVRISVGIESAKDIIADFDRAISFAGGS